MSQFFVDNNSTPGSSINTLSAQGGAPTNPSGTNFDFSGTATGAFTFATPSNGHMTGAVQVDGTTIIINGSNKLQSVATSFTWNGVAGTSQTMVAGNGYICTGGSLTTLTLPATATAFTDIVKIVGYGSGGIKIAQPANTQITLADGQTTGGSLTSFVQSASNQYCTLSLICVVGAPNYVWAQFEPTQGNFTITA